MCFVWKLVKLDCLFHSTSLWAIVTTGSHGITEILHELSDDIGILLFFVYSFLFHGAPVSLE